MAGKLLAGKTFGIFLPTIFLPSFGAMASGKRSGTPNQAVNDFSSRFFLSQL
jgi:hypothetical protein